MELTSGLEQTGGTAIAFLIKEMLSTLARTHVTYARGAAAAALIAAFLIIPAQGPTTGAAAGGPQASVVTASDDPPVVPVGGGGAASTAPLTAVVQNLPVGSPIGVRAVWARCIMLTTRPDQQPLTA